MNNRSSEKKLSGGRIAVLIVLVCIIAFLGIIGIMNGIEKAKKESQTTQAIITTSPSNSLSESLEPSPAQSRLEMPTNIPVYPEGQYVVGDDIPAGEYFVLADIYHSCLVEVRANTSDVSDVADIGMWIKNFFIIAVTDGQYLIVEHGEFCALSDAPQITPVEGAWEEGMYKVGKMLPPGEYFIYADREKMSCWMSVDSDASGKREATVAGYWVYNFGIITVKNGQYLYVERGEIYDLADAPQIIPVEGVWEEGMYKVGTMLPPGEYILTAKEEKNPWYEISRDSTHTSASMIDISNFGGMNAVQVLVEEGQYLLVKNATIKAK